MKLLKLNITVKFAWYDLWLGIYFDRADKILYVFPIPMLGFRIERDLAAGRSAAESRRGLLHRVVRLPVSDSESVKCSFCSGLDCACNKPAVAEAFIYLANGWYPYCEQHIAEKRFMNREIRQLSDAPQRSGGERRKANDKLTDHR